MKNTKYIAILFLALLLFGCVAFEFYVWRSHGYASNYNTIQDCIEQGGAWDKKTAKCLN